MYAAVSDQWYSIVSSTAFIVAASPLLLVDLTDNISASVVVVLLFVLPGLSLS